MRQGARWGQPEPRLPAGTEPFLAHRPAACAPDVLHIRGLAPAIGAVAPILINVWVRFGLPKVPTYQGLLTLPKEPGGSL